MRADSVDISWDANKSNWLIRIQSGEEVIRRHCDLARGADDSALRSAAQKTVKDEGYELDSAKVTIHRPAA